MFLLFRPEIYIHHKIFFYFLKFMSRVLRYDMRILKRFQMLIFEDQVNRPFFSAAYLAYMGKRRPCLS